MKVFIYSELFDFSPAKNQSDTCLARDYHARKMFWYCDVNEGGTGEVVVGVVVGGGSGGGSGGGIGGGSGGGIGVGSGG